jgi:hypothetical protein
MLTGINTVYWCKRAGGAERTRCEAPGKCSPDHEGDRMKKLIAMGFFAALAAGPMCGCATRGDATTKAPSASNFMGEHPELDENEHLVNEEFKSRCITAQC